MSEAKFDKKELKKRSENLSDWYTDVVLKAELADYGPVRGTMVIRPYGYAIWERVQEIIDGMIKPLGVENAYFPLFIPYSFLKREKEHVEGFSPELALVTHGGGEDLAEPLVVRPTSETIMYEMYSKWINSWRDLPVLINQWNNVVRWEKRTLLFLRTMEFLWQEGHTAHATEEEAGEFARKILDFYVDVYERYFAIKVVRGIKSESEKFAGALKTYGVEALMPDGKALQAGTSHHLGQNFAKAFNITFQDKEGNTQHVWQTSWGLSTRSLGGLFMTHGDDDGLIMPPKIAPVQVVIIPIYKNDNREDVVGYSNKIKEELSDKGIRVRLDDNDNVSVGRKFNNWEVKGVPVRLEIGEAEKNENVVTVYRRDTKEKSKISDLGEINNILEDVQNKLFEKSVKIFDENTHEVENYDQFKEIMSSKKGMIKAFWCGDENCEASIKEETKATTRVRPFDEDKAGKCVKCGSEGKLWYFAQAY